jgi:hypothetical protein
MTTLNAPPLQPLLDRLFKEADSASPDTSPAVADLFQERDRLLRSKTEYLGRTWRPVVLLTWWNFGKETPWIR